MKNKFIYLICSFIFVLAFNCIAVISQNFSGKKCLAYEPAIVNLEGKLIRKNVINASEQKESIWILKLSNEICVAADANNEFNSAVGRIAEVQLVFSIEQLRKYRNLQNQTLLLSGTLFGAHSQHHFTEVLLMVDRLRKPEITFKDQ